MHKQNEDIGVGLSAATLFTLVAIILMAGVLGGCGVRTDFYVYGQTPVGFDNRLATSLSDKPAKKIPNKLSAVSNDGY